MICMKQNYIKSKSTLTPYFTDDGHTLRPHTYLPCIMIITHPPPLIAARVRYTPPSCRRTPTKIPTKHTTGGTATVTTPTEPNCPPPLKVVPQPPPRKHHHKIARGKPESDTAWHSQTLTLAELLPPQLRRRRHRTGRGRPESDTAAPEPNS